MRIRLAFPLLASLAPLVSCWVCSVALAACGVPHSVALPDGDEDAGDDATAADGGIDGAFQPSDAAPLLDAPAAAMGHCEPPCAASELCYANVVTGGRAPGGDSGTDSGTDADPDGAVDGAVDADADAGRSIGCHALPPACAPPGSATCACVLEALGNVCAFEISCDADAGSPVVLCTQNLP